MVQVLLFALVGFSSALVNLGIYNLVLWGLQFLGWLPDIDFLIAQFFWLCHQRGLGLLV